MARRALVSLPIALCLFVAACGGGGGGSDADQVRGAVRDFAQATVDGDGDKACEQLTTQATEQLEKLSGQDCGKVFASIKDRINTDQAKKQLDQVDDLKIKVDGDKATVSTGESGDQATNVVKQDGEWKIDINQ